MLFEFLLREEVSGVGECVGSLMTKDTKGGHGNYSN